MRLSPLLSTLLLATSTLSAVLPHTELNIREIMKRYANDSSAQTIPAVPVADLVALDATIATTADAEKETVVYTTTNAYGQSLTTTSTLTSTIIVTIGTKSGKNTVNKDAVNKAAVAATAATVTDASTTAGLVETVDALAKKQQIAALVSATSQETTGTSALTSAQSTCPASTVTVTVTPTWCSATDSDLAGVSGLHYQKVTLFSTNTHLSTSTITIPVTVTFTNINGSTTNIITASSLIETGVEQTSYETITIYSTKSIEPTTYVTTKSTSTTYSTVGDATATATATAGEDDSNIAASSFNTGYQNNTNVDDISDLNILSKRAFFE